MTAKWPRKRRERKVQEQYCCCTVQSTHGSVLVRVYEASLVRDAANAPVHAHRRQNTAAHKKRRQPKKHKAIKIVGYQCYIQVHTNAPAVHLNLTKSLQSPCELHSTATSKTQTPNCAIAERAMKKRGQDDGEVTDSYLHGRDFHPLSNGNLERLTGELPK